MTCILCQPLDADQVYVTNYWRVIVNYNQNKLGKCFIGLRRHDEDVCNLSGDEVLDLWAIVRKVKAALGSCFQPDHFNYAFLMNQDAHVHLHVIPRYREKRGFAGVEFQDSDSVTERRLPEHIHAQVVTTLRQALAIQDDTRLTHRVTRHLI